jgi:hypothetical protein
MNISQPTAGQVYESCHPRDAGLRIQVLSTGGGRARVQVVDGSPLVRAIPIGSLHSSGTTGSGAPRRTGYRLLTPPDGP